MAYEYYCMSCGKLLSQETVPFDMQYLLTRDKEKKFQLLKFRMTKAELQALIEKGVPGEAGYRSCTITFEEIMQIIANKNNLNAGKVYTERTLEGEVRHIASDDDIASLTLSEIDAYIAASNEALASQSAKDEFDPFADIEDEEEEQKEETQEEYKPSAAIFALEAKDETNTDKAYTKVILRTDLEVLRGLFIQNETYTFQIKEENDIDNEGQNILVGYCLAGSGHLTVEARVCPGCGDSVFPHAGTAKHQAVAFIGYQAAGKTSTILALTHYAANHMMADLSDFGDENAKLWSGIETISSVASAELLTNPTRLMEDLRGYGEGLAPAKTEAGKNTDAYSATFRIKNRTENKSYLFTLTDLPGELCNEDGTIKTDRIRDHFPVALSCDAFVACFDTSSINPNGGGVATWVTNVCKWADAFQKMRAEHHNVNTYVPTMLLFTKCRDLEGGTNAGANPRALLPIDNMYILRDEKRQIGQNALYNFVCDQFNEFGHLEKAYHAMMRCSPFGYRAPSKQDLQGPKKDEFVQQQPTPKNIEKLMRWLLSVSGCIPTEAKFVLNPMAGDGFKLDNYCLSRPQLRNENPIKEHEVEESMARCTLFENPGKFDKDYVGKHDSKARLVVVKMMSNMQKNKNAD